MNTFTQAPSEMQLAFALRRNLVVVVNDGAAAVLGNHVAITSPAATQGIGRMR